MATSLYGQLQDIATSVLRDFSQGNVLLRRVTESSGDPAKPWEPGPKVIEDFQLAATVRGVSRNQIDGTLITSDDLVVTCAVKAGDGTLLDPKLTDTMLIDGVAHRIKRIDAAPAAGTPVSYSIFVAR